MQSSTLAPPPTVSIRTITPRVHHRRQRARRRRGHPARLRSFLRQLARVHVSRVIHRIHSFIHHSFIHRIQCTRDARDATPKPSPEPSPCRLHTKDKRWSSHTLDYVRESTSNHPLVRNVRTIVRTSSIYDTQTRAPPQPSRAPEPIAGSRSRSSDLACVGTHR